MDLISIDGRAVSIVPSGARLKLIHTASVVDSSEFANAVRAGLTAAPKRLPCRFFYDEEGSRLFETICTLPEYYLTRAEKEILSSARKEITGLLPHPVTLVELGSGSSAKTRLLIETFLSDCRSLLYVPIDISRSMLEASSLELLEDYPRLSITAISGEYRQGLAALRRHAGSVSGGSKLILWLGSNVGNLSRGGAADFLRSVTELMGRSDRLLVGIDLRKDPGVIQRAYDDPGGVTARFNLNLLARINRELGADFDLSRFTHEAVYNEPEGRVEIFIASARAQKVRIEKLGLEVVFAAGETIHTENSYKYSVEEIESLAAAAGLSIQRSWLDSAERFSVNLLARREPSVSRVRGRR